MGVLELGCFLPRPPGGQQRMVPQGHWAVSGEKRGFLELGANCGGTYGPRPGRGLCICVSRTSVILGLRGTRSNSVPEKPPFLAHHVASIHYHSIPFMGL